MVKQMLFKPKGMNRDNAVSVFSSEQAYQIDNMRIKAFDSNNQFSLTSIKGTQKWFEGLKGTPIGHATINNNYIIFTTGDTTTEGKPDHIYKVNNSGISSIYNGDLNFDSSYPLETLVYYENEDIQKVYWTDGINQPRSMNISKIYDTSYNFDFLKPITYVNIEVSKLDNSGSSISPGVVQYIVTGYNNFESESSILAESILQYISYEDRGGKPDDFVSSSFEVRLEGDINYDNIRLYRIYRTSLEGEIKADLVAEMPNSDNVIIIDRGQSLGSIDPSELLYKGGTPIKAKTFSQKDGTLFLGNVELKNNGLGEISFTGNSNLFDFFYAEAKKETPSKYILTSSSKKIKHNTYNNFYQYKPDLDSGESVKYFKRGETYRLGFIGVDKYGNKSDVIWVGDKEQTTKVVQDLENQEATVGTFTLSLHQDIITKIKEAGFISIIPVAVYPTLSDRTIKAQGIVSPTVYNVEDRYNGTCDIQASWFFRPQSSRYEDLAFEHGNTLDTKVVQYDEEIDGTSYEGKTMYLPEVQSAEGPHLKIPAVYYTTDKQKQYGYPVGAKQFVDLFKNRYFVDSNTITLNSPEIDQEYITNTENLKFRITSYIKRLKNQYRNYLDYTFSNGSFSGEAYIRQVPYFPDILGEESLELGPVIPSFYDELTVDNSAQGRFFAVHPWHRNGSLNSDTIPTGDSVRTAILQHKVMSRTEVFPYYIQLEDTEIKSLNYSNTQQQILLFNSSEDSILKFREENSYKDSFIYKANIDTINNPVLSNAEDIVPIEDITISGIYFYEDGNYPLLYDGITVLLDQEVGKIEQDSLLRYWKQNSLGYFIYASYSEDPKNNNPKSLYWFKKFGNEYIDSSYALLGKDPTSIKYKSTPHAVINLGKSSDKPNETKHYYENLLPSFFKSKKAFIHPYTPYFCEDSQNPMMANYQATQNNYGQEDSSFYILWIGELYDDSITNRFGGNDKSVLQNNTWIKCGEAVDLNTSLVEIENFGKVLELEYSIGDTYFQRYDCLKTYPYAEGDTNSIVNIVSAPIETRINLDLRTDRNRGLEDNTSIRPSNFNLFNPVYNQTNNFFNYHVIDQKQFQTKIYKNTITWTKTKLAGATTDTWTNITMANILELDGDKGEITALKRFNNNIVAFQETGISQILYNENVQISTTQGVPIEIANSGKVQGKRYLSEQIGCTNKWSICESPLGLYFVDEKTEGIYLFNGQLTNLSDQLGFSSWIKQYYSTTRSIWNPNSFNNFITYYDKQNKEVLFINKDTCLAYSEYLKQFTSFYSYGNVPYFGYIDNQFISINNESVYKNEKGDYSEFYGEFKPFGVTVIANADAPYDKIFNTLEFRTSSQNDQANPSVQCSDYTFNYINVWNDYQKAEDYLLFLKNKVSNLKRKFRIWRANIPREGRDRMRNPWLFIKMTRNDSYAKPYPLELHDMIVQYFI